MLELYDYERCGVITIQMKIILQIMDHGRLCCPFVFCLSTAAPALISMLVLQISGPFSARVLGSSMVDDEYGIASENCKCLEEKEVLFQRERAWRGQHHDQWFAAGSFGLQPPAARRPLDPDLRSATKDIQSHSRKFAPSTIEKYKKIIPQISYTADYPKRRLSRKFHTR